MSAMHVSGPAKKVSSKEWERTLGCYKRELVFKVSALALIGMANLVGIAYAGYRFYEIVPLSWTKAIVYTPLIAGLLLTVVVYKKILTGKTEMPNGFNEKTASIYNPLLILSSLLSFGLLLPFVAAISKTDLTNYAHRTAALTTAHRLRHRPFREISRNEAAHYSTLLRLGFIQEKDSNQAAITLDDFKIVRVDHSISITPQSTQLGVREWIKKAHQTMKGLEEELQETILLSKGAQSDSRVQEKINSIKKAMEILNTFWEEKAPSICPEYTGKLGDSKRSWFEKTFLHTPGVDTTLKNTGRSEVEDGGEEAGEDDVSTPPLTHLHV